MLKYFNVVRELGQILVATSSLTTTNCVHCSHYLCFLHFKITGEPVQRIVWSSIAVEFLDKSLGNADCGRRHEQQSIEQRNICFRQYVLFFIPKQPGWFSGLFMC